MALRAIAVHTVKSRGEYMTSIRLPIFVQENDKNLVYAFRLLNSFRTQRILSGRGVPI